MTEVNCNVCAKPLGSPIYESSEKRSLTSLCRIHPGSTSVYACEACGHLQTLAIDNVDTYYDLHYDILVDSEEEDQVYEVRDGAPYYRTQHQVATIKSKLDLGRKPEILDYGCAKSSTLRTLCQEMPGLKPHLFDVSPRYQPFWHRFAEPGNCAVNTTPIEWADKFDVVTSLFSLEHIPSVASTMQHIHSLLKPGGCFYAVVPDVFGNVADFVVVDHCNHFTRTSLHKLLADAGLEAVQVDSISHRGALVVTARKPMLRAEVVKQAQGEVQAVYQRLAAIADYWAGAGSRIRAFERELAPGERVAIYGAGFYGAFIASSLLDPARICCHLDQNPYLTGSSFDGRPVVAPTELPEDIHVLLVGLNPTHARDVIEGIPALRSRQLAMLYL